MPRSARRTTTKAEAFSAVGALIVIGIATAVAWLSPNSDNRQNEHDGDRPTEREATVDETYAAGRGHFATTPGKIPLAGWKDILWRTYEQIGDDRLLAVAAGIVFNGLLALFPAITAIVSSYALIIDPHTISDHLSFLANVVPEGTFSIVQDQVGRVLSQR